MTERIKINFSLEALRAKRAELVRLNQKEYQTRGNTARCQELWSQIEKIDDEIARRFMKGEELKRCSNCPVLPWEDERKYCSNCSMNTERMKEDN